MNENLFSYSKVVKFTMLMDTPQFKRPKNDHIQLILVHKPGDYTFGVSFIDHRCMPEIATMVDKKGKTIVR